MFGTVETRVRPLRLACLVEQGAPGQARKAMQLCSSLWGGRFNPIITLFDEVPDTWNHLHQAKPTPEAAVQGLLDAFDPDVLISFVGQVPTHVSNRGIEIVNSDEVWHYLGEGVRYPTTGVGVFELLDDVFEEWFRFETKYRPRMVLPSIDGDGLFWTGMCGDYPDELRPILMQRYTEPLAIESVACTGANFSSLIAPNTILPIQLTRHRLEQYRHAYSLFRTDVFLMDMTSAEDVIDFWNLRALGRRVLPLPKQLAHETSVREVLVAFLRENRTHRRNQPEYCETAGFMPARSCTFEEVQEYAKTIKLEIPSDDPSKDGFYHLNPSYPRIWDEWDRDRNHASADDHYAEDEDRIDFENTTKVRVKALVPKFAEPDWLYNTKKCANEISFEVYGASECVAQAFPQHSGPAFDRAISGLASFGSDWRVDRHGLVKIARNKFAETREIPSAESVFFAWLEDHKWKPCLSASGMLAKQIYSVFEGSLFPLRRPELLELFEHMNGGKSKKNLQPPDAPTPEPEPDAFYEERTVNAGQLMGQVAPLGPKDFFEWLLARKVFKIGLQVQCPKCTRRSWLDLESLRDELNCPKCLNTFRAAGTVNQGSWSFKTAGPFSVPNHAEGAYCVLLTLRAFEETRMTSMRLTPAMSFKATGPGGEKLEADLGFFWQESIYGHPSEGVAFVECKTYGKFDDADYERMRTIARNFPGAVLVFSTLRKSLEADEIMAITEIAEAGRTYWKSDTPINPVMVLTGTELLSDDEPPSCWDQPRRDRFRNSPGILNLCDATQQIYLGLKSWRSAWHDNWGKYKPAHLGRP